LFSSALFTKTWRRSEPLPAAARLLGLAVPPFLKACSDRRKDFGGSARFGVRVTILTRSLPALLRGTGSVAKHASLNSLTVKSGSKDIKSWSRSHVCAMEIRISHKESSASSRTVVLKMIRGTRLMLAIAAIYALLPSAAAFSLSPALGSLASAPRACALRRGSPLAERRPRALAPSILQLEAKGPRPLHKEFTVEKATPEQLEEMQVKSWGQWSTKGSPKYKVGVKSPLKVYDCNELSYIISGKMEIIPEATGEPVLVQVDKRTLPFWRSNISLPRQDSEHHAPSAQAGDFVTFPDGFPCYWYVIEEINKHYYIY